jgi:choline dehydrogenase-like flavoprotein
VNPTLTIIANSLRVAEHIAQRLGSPPTAEPEPLPAEQPDARQPDVAVTAPA